MTLTDAIKNAEASIRYESIRGKEYVSIHQKTLAALIQAAKDAERYNTALDFYTPPDLSSMPNNTKRDKIAKYAKLADWTAKYMDDQGKTAREALKPCE